MTTEEAFIELVNNKEYILTLPLNERNAIRSYKSQWNRDKMNLKKTDTLLERHGYVLIQEPLWEHKTRLIKKK